VSGHRIASYEWGSCGVGGAACLVTVNGEWKSSVVGIVVGVCWWCGVVSEELN